jgi:hypothetical protein
MEGFEILGKAAVAIEPSEGAFDDPAAGKDEETARRLERVAAGFREAATTTRSQSENSAAA